MGQNPLPGDTIALIDVEEEIWKPVQKNQMNVVMEYFQSQSQEDAIITIHPKHCMVSGLSSP